jgi:acetyl/propionyl-CoA carboxylase alpha subunit
VVREAGSLAEAVAGAKREALSSFGDDTLIIERYVDEPRHIEIQILGDRHGNLVHLFERECSIQRRHQKVIEESPSVFLTPELREKMGAAAVAAGKAIGYFNAGTVEFITAPDGAFYFLEVNTRLQVEHPVTELVTGLDLVELQLRIAEGAPLPFAQGDLVSTGAALECRLYAEDPEKGFLPGGGPVVDWHLPEVDGLRVDTGVTGGSQIPNDYDPMIAKVITWGRDREEARRRMVRSLEQMSAMGTANNRSFLLRVLEHPAYRSGAIHTHFIEEHKDELLGQGASAETLARAVAAAGLVSMVERASQMPVPGARAGFRLLRAAGQRQAYRVGEQELTLAYEVERDGSFAWTVGEQSGRWRLVSRDGARLVVESSEGWRRPLRVVQRGEPFFVHLGREEVMVSEVPRFVDPASRKVEGGCVAPMSGKVVKVAVAVGDAVVRGQQLLVLEAMKMEHTISAPEAGRIVSVAASLGQQVEGGQLLAVIEPIA